LGPPPAREIALASCFAGGAQEASEPSDSGPHFTEMCCGTEAGSYLRLIDSCITQLKAHGPSRTCNEIKKKKLPGEAPRARGAALGPPPAREIALASCFAGGAEEASEPSESASSWRRDDASLSIWVRVCGLRFRILRRNVQRFRGGLVFKTSVSLNSRLESNKEEVQDLAFHGRRGGGIRAFVFVKEGRCLAVDLESGLGFAAHRLMYHSA